MSKTLMRPFFIIALALLFSGCAGGDPTRSAQHALVCPSCKTVAVPIDEPYYVGDRPSWFGRSAAVTYKHACPNCHGSLLSRATNGKWQHECSVCKASPYNCPIIHPRPSRVAVTASAP